MADIPAADLEFLQRAQNLAQQPWFDKAYQVHAATGGITPAQLLTISKASDPDWNPSPEEIAAAKAMGLEPLHTSPHSVEYPRKAATREIPNIVYSPDNSKYWDGIVWKDNKTGPDPKEQAMKNITASLKTFDVAPKDLFGKKLGKVDGNGNWINVEDPNGFITTQEGETGKETPSAVRIPIPAYKAMMQDYQKAFGGGDTPAKAQPGATPDPFTVGKKYKDAGGNVRTYAGGGKWK